MKSPEAQELLDKVIGQIFGYKNPYTLDQFLQKFAFDIRLPIMVNDSTTGEQTWVQSAHSGKYMTLNNIRKAEETGMFDVPKQPIDSIEDLLKLWEKINHTATERQLDSINVIESDHCTQSENVYRSLDTHRSKNVLFCDGAIESEYVVGCQRSFGLTYCARVDDSRSCSASFNVSWSSKVVNGIFISDCYDVYECMFSSHLASRKFVIANMQFEEEEYMKIKEKVVRWILTQ